MCISLNCCVESRNGFQGER